MDLAIEKEWAARGLSAPETAKRLAVEGPNELPSARPRTWLRIAIDALKEPMFSLLVAIGAWRISRKQVLTRRVPAIETLGAS
jgi:magnesium-transporting ATPase (P-type)